MRAPARRPFHRALIGALVLACTLAGNTALLHASEANANWVATWQASPEQPRDPRVTLNNQTIRQYARISLGGSRFRVRLSNEFSDTPLQIGAARIAIAGENGSFLVDSDRALSFNGAADATIPAGAFLLSDPVDIQAPALASLAISLYVPGNVRSLTEHFFAMQDAWIAQGDATASATLERPRAVSKRAILSGVEVVAGSRRTKVVVAFGDSLVGGFGSTPNANQRWTDLLAARIAAKKSPLSVVNAGIGGNRLLHDFIGPNGLSRFDRDVLSQPGVSHVVVLIGINDFGLPGGRNRPQEEVTVEQVVAGMRQLITRAHARGVKVIGATLLPFGPIPERPGYYSDASVAKRDALNQWIRQGKAFDGVIDFDAIMRDPANPKQLRPEYDSGDRMHPNDLGYKAMAEAIDLKLFD